MIPPVPIYWPSPEGSLRLRTAQRPAVDRFTTDMTQLRYVVALRPKRGWFQV